MFYDEIIIQLNLDDGTINILVPFMSDFIQRERIVEVSSGKLLKCHCNIALSSYSDIQCLLTI